MLNQVANPLGLIGLAGDGVSLVTDILPAEELPSTPPQAEGLMVEHQDHVILIQSSQPNSDARGVEVGSAEDIGNGPKIEVVINTETILYRDTTQPPSQRPSPDNNPPILQTVETGRLGDLEASHSLIIVWGRRTGDRIIAEVLVYSNRVLYERP
jgi:hypothetical protein